MTLTRESLLWWALLVLSLITALATLGDSAAVALGIPAMALPYLRLIAFLTAAGAAWAKTSPFPSKNDASQGSVNLKKMAPLVLLACALGAGAVTSTSCAKAPPTLSPAGAAAFQARRVLDVLRIVRDTAVDANAQTPPLISTVSARKIVTWHESLVKAIAVAPSGVRAVVEASLTQLQADITATDWSRIAPYISLLRSLLMEVQ